MMIDSFFWIKNIAHLYYEYAHYYKNDRLIPTQQKQSSKNNWKNLSTTFGRWKSYNATDFFFN